MVFYGQPDGPAGAVRLTSQNAPAEGGAKETTFAVAIEIHAGGASRRWPSPPRSTAPGAASPSRRSAGSRSPSSTPARRWSSNPGRYGGHERDERLTLGELYLRNGQWKFRAVGQGFGRRAEAASRRAFGVSVDDEPEPAPPSSAPRRLRPPRSARRACRASAPHPRLRRLLPRRPPPPRRSNLSKVTLTKEAQVDSTSPRKPAGGGYGEVRINLNWNRKPRRPPSGGGGFFGFGKPKGGRSRSRLPVRARRRPEGRGPGAGATASATFDGPPFVQLSADDRTGQSVDGEWMRINGPPLGRDQARPGLRLHLRGRAQLGRHGRRGDGLTPPTSRRSRCASTRPRTWACAP